MVQDLKKKPKYLVTFTVGYEQRHNINAAVQKVIEIYYFQIFIYTFLFVYLSFHIFSKLLTIKLFCSFLMILQFCSFIMMVGLVNGINLSGQRMQSMLAQGNKLNGIIRRPYHSSECILLLYSFSLVQFSHT